MCPPHKAAAKPNASTRSSALPVPTIGNKVAALELLFHNYGTAVDLNICYETKYPPRDHRSAMCPPHKAAAKPNAASRPPGAHHRQRGGGVGAPLPQLRHSGGLNDVLRDEIPPRKHRRPTMQRCKCTAKRRAAKRFSWTRPPLQSGPVPSLICCKKGTGYQPQSGLEYGMTLGAVSSLNISLIDFLFLSILSGGRQQNTLCGKANFPANAL